MKKGKTYEEKIKMILEYRLEQNCNYGLEIKNVIIWLLCECSCGEIDVGTYCRLKDEVYKVADEILRRV